jgi:hypothetical protein
MKTVLKLCKFSEGNTKAMMTSEGVLLATLKSWQSPSRAQRVRAYACACMRALVCLCLCVYMCASAYICVLVRAHVYVCVRACVYSRMHLCLYVCACT